MEPSSTGEAGPTGPGTSGAGDLPPSTPRGLNDTYSPGKKIGENYELIRPLGQGGMATVWVAHNEALDIRVAIKFIRTDLKEQVKGLDSRLLQEARAAARLGHPAIVRVSDFGKTTAGDPYIVMELLTGEDLAQALARRGPLEPLRAVRTLLPIADALAAAHDAKIVHRDLKPENVFLADTPEGRTQPKLVDFGIAKLEREDAGGKRITEAGRAMGSPAYMSPEQARGQDVDARTDIWSMCVMLYEVLTRKLPFDAESYPALVAAILEQEPKSILEHGVLEPALWEIIRHGLKKQPDKRWQDMRALGAALANWAIEQGADDDISGRSLMCTWIERPPDSLRAGARQSVTAITAVTELPDYDPESIRKPTPAMATPPSTPALLASGSQLAVSMESSRRVPTKWIVGLAITLPLLVLAVVLLIIRPSGQGGATSAAPVRPGPPASGMPVAIPAAPPVAVPTQTKPPAVEPSSSAAQPRSGARSNSRVSAQRPAASAPAASTGAPAPLPSGKKPSWDTDSPLPPQ